MRSHVRLALVVLPILALGGSPAAAHEHCGRHHGCPDCPAASEGDRGCPDCVSRSAGAPGLIPGDRALGGAIYDVDTVTTLRGTVTAVTVVPARGGRSGGTHLTLESEGAVTEAHLGPTWFLEREDLKLSKGDAVEVTGSIVDSGGATFLVVREIKKGAKVIRLRDERGLPLWAGGASRQ
jgi:hypothetical protein